jgi:hypothetical protein
MPTDQPTEPPPYTVTTDTPGCEDCGHGASWAVVGPGGVAESVSYDDIEDAEAMAAALNDAFQQGQAHR